MSTHKPMMWRKIEHPSKAGLVCTEQVRVAEADTFNRRNMRAKRTRLGLPENACGNTATHSKGDRHLCQNHAGQLALKEILARDKDRDCHYCTGFEHHYDCPFRNKEIPL